MHFRKAARKKLMLLVTMPILLLVGCDGAKHQRGDCIADKFPDRNQANLASRSMFMRAVEITLVPRDGIEPPTRGFSIPCSTN